VAIFYSIVPLFKPKVLTRVVSQIGLVVILKAAPLAIRVLLQGIIVDVIRSARGHYPGPVLLDDTLHFLLEDVKDIGRALELTTGNGTKQWGALLEPQLVRIVFVLYAYPHLTLEEMLIGDHEMYGTRHRFQGAVLPPLRLVSLYVMRWHLQDTNGHE